RRYDWRSESRPAALSATPVLAPLSGVEGVLRVLRQRSLSLLIGCQKRPNIFHCPFQPTLDLHCHLLQFVVLALQFAEAPGEVFSARGFGLQPLFHHRLQPAQRVVHAVPCTCCLGRRFRLDLHHAPKDKCSVGKRSTCCPCGASSSATSG